MNFVHIVTLAVIVLVVDMIWLTAMGPAFLAMVRRIQGGDSPTFRILPAIVVYLSLGYLVSLPTSYTTAFLLGLSVYSVYDYTNLAIFKNYDWKIALADAIWGGVLFTLVYAIRKRFL